MNRVGVQQGAGFRFFLAVAEAEERAVPAVKGER